MAISEAWHLLVNFLVDLWQTFSPFPMNLQREDFPKYNSYLASHLLTPHRHVGYMAPDYLFCHNPRPNGHIVNNEIRWKLTISSKNFLQSFKQAILLAKLWVSELVGQWYEVPYPFSTYWKWLWWKQRDPLKFQQKNGIMKLTKLYLS